MRILIVIIGIGVILIFSYVLHFLSFPTPQSFNYVPDVAKSMKETKPIKLPPVIYEGRVKRRPPRWQRDPFKPSETKEVIKELKLQAISVDAEGRGIAMINGEIYHENDVVGIYKIKKINRDYIIVEKGGSNIIIRMEEGEKK